MNEIGNFRINVIAKQDNTLRISVVVSHKTTVAKLKRTIQQEYHELFNINILISVIEDSQGFVLSNNSVAGDHLRPGDTVYVQSHKDKLGTNMNLPSNLPDLFLTLRYVSGSVIKRLLEVQAQISPLQVVPEIIHLGFWYSNSQTVASLCKVLNKIFTPDNLDNYYLHAHEMQNTLLLKLLYFWFAEVKESFTAFTDVVGELLAVLYKLSLNKNYGELLSNHKILKAVLELSKEQMLQPELKRMAIQIVRNVTGKGGLTMKVQSSYIPSALGQSTFELSNIEEVLEALSTGTQQNKSQALQQLVEQPKLISQASVRFEYYWKLTGIFLMRSIKDKTTSRIFSQVVKTIASNTTKEKASQIMQKDVIKRIHNFLLDSHIDSHPAVYEYYSLITKQSSTKGMFNIQQASELLNSPYPQFQKISAEGLAQMSEKKVSLIRFLPSIKDYLRIALKSQDPTLSTYLMRTIGNLTLDQQCRYQIVNLKGIEVFIKFLEIGQKNSNSELQRACAKGLLNLSIGSRETKAKILGHLSGILEHFYKGGFDTIAGSYIESILKSPKI